MKDKPLRVLVVDDSPTMRRLIRAGIETHPRIQVVGEAGNAIEARDAVKALQPDVMTLDVEMPGMSGIEFLERLMRARPMPVIMLSTLTGAGSDASVRALSLGAVDCVEKPHFGDARATFEQLTRMLLVAADARVGRGRAHVARAALPPTGSGWRWNGRWILIGSSTGGVEALETVLQNFPANCPPTLITQHMPAQFLRSFAARLNATMQPNVRVATDGLRPGAGDVIIAPGDNHMRLSPGGDSLRLSGAPKRSGHRPSVDEMFGSALPHAQQIIAAILTGMGRDGAEEMLRLRQAGARCIGQNADSCVVYGMPRVAHSLGAVEEQLPLAAIGPRLLELAAA
ncbi:MAG: chemotaxis response regulator protein-glutamate methylesterase [Rhodobacterales bacterium]|nr:MAG: chemotaxis response regulator protein-glutamate methylesterase [Rhodobacterales bacterium]